LFERFTERARQVVVLAQEEARTLKHDHVGPEHLLLGLLREGGGPVAPALESFDITLERVRGEVVRIVGVGNAVNTGQMPFTHDAKRVLEVAMQEARALGHNYIGTEHLLLALLEHEDGDGPLTAAGATKSVVETDVAAALAAAVAAGGSRE